MLTEPWKREERRCSVVDGGVQAAGRGGARGPGAGSLLRTSVKQVICEAGQMVSRARGSPAARNRGGATTHRRRRLVQFRQQHGPGSRVKALGGFLVPKRSRRGGSWWAWCGGAATPRRCRGAAAWRNKKCGGLGFGRRVGWIGCRGCGLGRLKEGWPGISVCARGKEIPGDLAGRFGRGCVEPGREGGRRS